LIRPLKAQANEDRVMRRQFARHHILQTWDRSRMAEDGHYSAYVRGTPPDFRRRPLPCGFSCRRRCISEVSHTRVAAIYFATVLYQLEY
jgi:hypothetical protein